MTARHPDNEHLPRGIQCTGEGKYRGSYYVERKLHRTPTYSSIKAAEIALAQARAEIAGGKWLDPARGMIPLGDWWGLWHPRRHLAAATKYSDSGLWSRHLEPHLTGVPLSELTAWKISAWLNDLEALGVSNVTRRKALTLLRTCLQGAIMDRRLHFNECVTVKRPKVEAKAWTLLDGATIERIIEQAPERYQGLILVASLTGIRWSEANGLRRADFDRQRSTVTVRNATVHVAGVPGGYVDKGTKSGKPRDVPLHPRASAALIAAFGDRIAPDARAFPRVENEPLNPSHFHRDVWVPAITRAGVSARFHDLRHSCASRLLAGGMDLAQVKEIMGHSSVTVTELYLHTDEDAKRAALLRAFG